MLDLVPELAFDPTIREAQLLSTVSVSFPTHSATSRVNEKKKSSNLNAAFLQPQLFFLPPLPSKLHPSTSVDGLVKMRNTLIFAGNSCPVLTGQICENLGMHPASAELTQFSNVSFPCPRARSHGHST
jgi:hypothetical protein